jgi:hypothetical protein
MVGLVWQVGLREVNLLSLVTQQYRVILFWVKPESLSWSQCDFPVL